MLQRARAGRTIGASSPTLYTLQRLKSNAINPAAKVVIITTIQRLYSILKGEAEFDAGNELPKGYDTLVGERGSSLSGGQRQRSTIVRAS